MPDQQTTQVEQPEQKDSTHSPSIKLEGVGDSISGSIGSNAQGAAIGKNIFQNIIVIGSVKIPVLPLIVLILLVAAAAAFFGLRMLGPAKMTGSFNLAVADFGQLDANGHVTQSAQGTLISQRLFEGLKIELDNLSPAERANFQPQVWQDSQPITQKRVKIGRIAGDTPQARWTAACSLAQKIHADVIIYGNIPADNTPNGFIPEFAICDNANLRIDADEIVGAHQLIQGLSTQLISQVGRPDTNLAVNLQVNAWSSTLSLFSIGIMYDLQGRPDLALKVFQQARDQANAGTQDASEVLWFFIGREDLTLSIQNVQVPIADAERATRLVDAQTAFEKALQINPGYARAHIGLGSVYFTRAQDQLPADRLNKPDLAAAIQEYQKALAAAPGSPGALIDTKARLGLASTWILQGEAQRDQGQLLEASDSFNQAIQAASDSLQALSDALQYRVLAQAYLSLGEAYHEQGHLALLQNNPAAARVLFEKASANYGLCIQQKDAAITDQTLANKIVAGFCVPYKQVVDASLADLTNH